VVFKWSLKGHNRRKSAGYADIQNTIEKKEGVKCKKSKQEKKSIEIAVIFSGFSQLKNNILIDKKDQEGWDERNGGYVTKV